MQPGNALGQQCLAHARGVLDADLAYRGLVVGVCPQVLGEASREAAARQQDGSLDAGNADDRHDAGDDRHVAAACRDRVAQPQVVLDMEEHLRDREVRASPDLRDEVVDVRLPAQRPEVTLGERRDAHGEVP